MPSTAQTTPQNIWPLGKLTLTAGSPVSVLSNVGSQDAGGGTVPNPQGRAYGSMCDQLIFSAPSLNSADVFVQYGKWNASDVNRTMLAIAKGTTVSIPHCTQTQSGQIDLAQIYVDGTTNDTVYVTAIGGN